MSRREIFENAGLKIYGFGNSDVHNQDGIVLNLENRDAKIEQYKRYIRDLGRAGFRIRLMHTWVMVSGVLNERRPVVAQARGRLTLMLPM